MPFNQDHHNDTQLTNQPLFCARTNQPQDHAASTKLVHHVRHAAVGGGAEAAYLMGVAYRDGIRVRPVLSALLAPCGYI